MMHGTMLLGFLGCGIILFIVVMCALMCVRQTSTRDVIRSIRSQKNVCIIYDPSKCDSQFVVSYGAFLRRCGYRRLVVGVDTLMSLDADIVVIWQWRSQTELAEVNKLRSEILRSNGRVIVILLSDSTVYSSSTKFDGMSVVNDIALLRTTLDGVVEVNCIY
jgi:hypothetical protein